MNGRTEVRRTTLTILRIAVVLGAIATLGACASIPQRAWANGRSMRASRAYQSVMGGNQSMQAHRELMASLDPRRLNYSELAYRPFGQWWY